MAKYLYDYEKLKKEFPKERLERFLLQEGYTYKRLQDEFKYEQHLWSRLAKEYGIPKQQELIYKAITSSTVKDIDPALLRRLYIDEHKSAREIGKLLNLQHSTVIKKLKSLNIEIRPFCDSRYYDSRRGGTGKTSIDGNGYVKEFGDRQHRNVVREQENRPLTSEEVVHHIDRDRTNNDPINLFLFPNNLCHQLFHGQHWTTSPQEFLDYYNNIIAPKLLNKDWLYEQYITLGKSVAQMSRELKIGRSTITKQLRNFGIYDLRARNVN